MRFVEENKGDRIEMTLHEHATIPEVLEAFERFLRACGYEIPYEKCLDLIEQEF